jgi:hypothetical protein
MNTLKRQRGLSMLAWMVIGSMAGLIFLVALKLTPLYLEYYSIVKILEQMQQDSSLKNADRNQLAQAFGKRLGMNGVENLNRDYYEIRKSDETEGALVIEFDYEVRRELFGNLSIVASFSDAVEVTGE